MLDNTEKTYELLAALKAAVPFDVGLSPGLISYLRTKNLIANPGPQTVSALSYAGDDGGIMCHLVQPAGHSPLVVSLTHIEVPRLLPLARGVQAYQKHRAKKIKKQRFAASGGLQD